MEMENAKNAKTNLSTEKYPLVQITRTFQAPVKRVWNAWSDGDVIKQWWGPRGFTAPSAKMDFREGGKYLLAMQAPDGKIMWSGGVIKEIIPNKKLIWTDHFSDQDGNSVSAKDFGMNGDWPEDLYITIELESENSGQTTMTMTHEGIPKEMHDDCVQGWNESIDKLQKLVEGN